MRLKGRLREWRDDKGFGFIEPMLPGPTIFVHIKAFMRPGRRPQVGDLLIYEVGRGANGKFRAEQLEYSLASGEASPSRRPSHRRAWPIPLAVLVLGGLTAAWAMGRLPILIPTAYVGMSVLAYLLYAWGQGFRAWRPVENQGKYTAAGRTLGRLAWRADCPGNHAPQDSEIVVSGGVLGIGDRQPRGRVVGLLHRLRFNSFDVGRARQTGFLVIVHIILVPLCCRCRCPCRCGASEARGQYGGHAVPLDKQRERFPRLWPLVAQALQMANEGFAYDNTSAQNPYRVVAHFENGKLIEPASWPDWSPLGSLT